MYNNYCLTEINFCDLNLLKNYIQNIEEKENTVIVISKSASERFCLSDLVYKNKFIWINSFNSNPTEIDIINSLKIIASNNISKIIAIGGGSAIDLAKAISAFYDININTIYTRDDIVNKILNKDYINTNIDIIAVPTTAGTGSEVTKWATIWDSMNNKKYSIDAYYLQPKQAFICTDLTLTMPKKLILSTALDALSHAIEAFWAKSTNSLSKELSIRAVELIVNNLPAALENPLYYECREKLSIASLIAGISFSKTKTTACHSISYPLTSMYKIEHGFAVALTLSELFEINKYETKNINELSQLFSTYGGIKNWLNSVCKNIVELRLSYFGVEKNDFENIVNNSFTIGRIDNNPVYLSRDELFEILNRIY
ncbi:phosphonoacetaldehyde reductase [uncultured Brachyspira sp.]|uniref:phosphonoacetaldehyde reductase n=1 Tax=uncultured Brachyspira sp. TaxID=221953 RepID=UPI00262DA6CA|nr:phosphonoacetaldehyde reductase [uncultured Brachyspira sp.]